REAGGVRLRPCREGSGRANGADDPRAASSAEDDPRLRRARRGDLSRAGAAAPEGGFVIARLRGTAVARRAEGLVLDVNGVGYLVAATPTALRRADGQGEVTLEIHTHVREDALQLY